MPGAQTFLTAPMCKHTHAVGWCKARPGYLCGANVCSGLPFPPIDPAGRFADKDSGAVRFLGSPETHLKNIACSAGHYFGDFHLKGTMAGRDGETNYRYQMHVESFPVAEVIAANK